MLCGFDDRHPYSTPPAKPPTALYRRAASHAKCCRNHLRGVYALLPPRQCPMLRATLLESQLCAGGWQLLQLPEDVLGNEGDG